MRLATSLVETVQTIFTTAVLLSAAVGFVALGWYTLKYGGMYWYGAFAVLALTLFVWANHYFGGSRQWQ